MSMIPARLIDLDGQTVMTDFFVESPPPPQLLRARMPRQRPTFSSFEDALSSKSLTIYRDTFVLERILGRDDGGPLAIYRRRL